MAIRGALRIGGGIDLGLAPLDLEARRARLAGRAARANGGRITRAAGNLPENLAKLFPGEAAAAFPLAMSVAGDSLAWRAGLIGAIVGLIVWLRYFATQPQGGGPPDWPAIFISVGSFLLFAASLGGFGVLLDSPERSTTLIALITTLWLAFISVIPVRDAPKPRPKSRGPARAQ